MAIEANLPTFHLNAALVRTSEVPDADWVNGCNRGGSCAPGIGIAVGQGPCKLQDWTLLDQKGQGRTPQNSQHIGQAAAVVNLVESTDFNDTASLADVAVGWVQNAVA